MKKVLSFVLVAIFTLSCGGGFDAKVEEGKILDVHDEVMPKLGEVMDLRRQVLAKATDLAESNPEDEALEGLRSLATELEDARKGMMTWMYDWAKTKTPHVSGQSTEEDQKAFFQAEMERVTKVKDDINSSIAAAKAVLK
ncbi:hypothetical protein BFP97_12320 [Roseivirga sp. 4D4]|uniref:hypothetical protein n=1 Tax=Roseivirga sp. 4D4 TaxID=1889784 RepID=UPI000853A093|nr:hypothetical protein [Roseivirga sp. 4D4]OEK02254.1 hypothetical protein BFP97_12320 [Roseivirga sp. 4D4]